MDLDEGWVSVSWGWGWVVWLSFWVYWDTFVADIGDESGVVISLVCDSLYTAIGKVDDVRSSNVATGVLVFIFGEVSARVTILYSIFISEGLGREFFYWVGFGVWSRGMVWWWGWASWDTSDSSNKCETNKSLYIKTIK